MNFSGFKLTRNESAKTGLCGLQLTENGAAIAHIIWKDNEPVLSCCDFLPSASSPELFLPALSYFVKRNKLEGVKCSWILQPTDYTLLTVDSLPVSSNEIVSALRWYVKDRIDYPIEKASIDYFTAPHVNQSAKVDFIYAIVAKKKYLENTSRLIAESGLDIHVIDIPELALRNISALQSASATNLGIVDTTSSRITLLLIQQGVISFIRQIEWNKKMGTERLPGEIQRSLDYYENELGQTAIQCFYLSPACQTYLPEIKTCLPFEAQELGWEKLKDKRCLTAVGGALRQQRDLYAPAN